MSAREIAVRDEGEVDFNSVRGKLAQLREEVSDASAERLVEIRLAAELIQNALKSRREASAASRDAAETRIRAERQLGRLLRRSVPEDLDVPRWMVTTWSDIASIPDDLFEDVVSDMLERNKTCSAYHVIENARRRSLRKLETGIWIAYDGAYYVSEGRRGQTPGTTPVRSLTAATLRDAREELARSAGLRRGWGESAARIKLDDAHARARRFAQHLSLLGETLSGEERKLVGEAEHRLQEAAGFLYDAFMAHMIRLADEEGAEHV